jgi:hypothetical protein
MILGHFERRIPSRANASQGGDLFAAETWRSPSGRTWKPNRLRRETRAPANEERAKLPLTICFLHLDRRRLRCMSIATSRGGSPVSLTQR